MNAESLCVPRDQPEKEREGEGERERESTEGEPDLQETGSSFIFQESFYTFFLYIDING